ncbi:MAG TPA: MATE family efflux transporter, partial [Candidatus Polarisedimenticolaceae bacterium]|nr:MATE family efflux transporter [Candidatus Polarisedimenticolaceae bacterium]
TFMGGAALLFLAVPGTIVRGFSHDPRVLAAGVALLRVAALFQLFDGLQVVGTGVLRGAGDTRTPFLWNLVGHWLLGLPLGAYLCFRRGWGVVGMWLGLSLGLIVVGTVLLGAWRRRALLFR